METKSKLDLYTKYVLIEPKRVSWNKLCDIIKVDHKQINRFLCNFDNNPYNLFQEIRSFIDLEWWTFSIDDQVEDKEFSKISKSDLVGRFWSWRHHSVVVWINLITLYHTDYKWNKFAVNWRVVDKKEWKTKNDYFMEMFKECITRWFKPSMITWDCWYSSEQNLNFITKQWIWFLFGIKSNRLVKKNDSDKYSLISSHSIPKEWLIVFLKWVWYVVVFEKDGNYYAYRDNYKTNDSSDVLKSITRKDFEIEHAKHRDIEEYHRALKQLCNIDKHFLRKKTCILTHIYCSIRAYCILEINRILWIIENIYDLARNNLKQYISSHILTLRLDWLKLVF